VVIKGSEGAGLVESMVAMDAARKKAPAE